MTRTLTRAERKQLRQIERGLPATDRVWAHAAFGSPSPRDRRRRTAICAVADVAALAVLGAGAVTVSMPTLFAGMVLANVALCCHLGGTRTR